MTRRIALLLEYDGTRFAGSQLQRNAETVQGVLEAAIGRTTLEETRVAFAGRTDAGVHALGQVASFVTQSALDPETLRRALNAWLPQDVVVRLAVEVERGFDPRRQALRRRYRYVIDNRPVRPALGRDRAWHVATPLDVDAMSVAARGVLGTHDFAPFASRLEDMSASTVRDLSCFDVTRQHERVICEVVANAFLPHQVRRMVGALVEVGKGKLAVEAYAALLDGAPASAGPAAPPQGLNLVEVTYEADPFGIVDQANRRTTEQ
ncbi:MAG TPA: tRNA pseudouridine(38-40) synthase TruA [Dehalococcoidia bacterium]|nr:tRNA pseudouridine(38-40) synthase TruA [Dehalococcoidia bacterium]